MSISSSHEYKDGDNLDISVLSVITSEPLGDTAVQLLNFIPDETRGKSSLKLNDDALTSLVDIAGNRPISIISICGQSSEGNSFLFSHIAKALEGLEKNDPVSPNFGDRPVQLSELKYERHLPSLSTQGIWVSRRPFIVKNTEDKEVAVLLMYTQGTDDITQSDDISAIVGLSILMSSVTIVNFYDNLQEDFLAALNTYVQYGLLALENPPIGVPFQQLKFLVQDWRMTSSFPFGSEGGKKFIKDALELQPGQLFEAALVRESIQRCFGSIDCFLMPHSGDHVINLNSLTGSASSDDLDPIYVEHLVEFIKGLTCPENLPVKQVVGKEITIIDLKNYLEGYLQVYNSYDGPSAKHLWEATLDGKIMTIVNSAVQEFHKIVGDFQAERNYLSEEEMVKTLSVAEEQAIGHFQRETKSESTVKIKLKEKILSEKLAEEKAEITKKNLEIRNKIMGAISLTTTKFRDLLEKAVGFDLGSNTFNFYDEDEIEKAANNALTTAIEFFKDSLKDYCSEKMIESEEKTLRLILTSTLENHKENNKSRRLAAVGEMLTLVDDHVTCYEKLVEKISAENKALDFDAIPDLECVKATQLKLFDERRTKGKEDFHSLYRESLKKKLDGSYLVLKTQHNSRLQEIQSELNTVIRDAEEEYSNWLEDFMKLGRRSGEELERKNIIAIDRILNEFNENYNPYPVEHSQHLECSNRLKSCLDGIFQAAMKKAEEEKQRILTSYQNGVTQSVDYYLEKMLEIIGTKAFLPETDLEENHNRVLREAIQIYDQAEKLGDLDNPQDFKQMMLLDCIGDHYRRLVSENKSRKGLIKEQARIVVRDCKDIYEDLIIENRRNLRTLRQLEDVHIKAKQKAFEEFGKKFPVQDYSAFLQEYEGKLGESIENTFQEFYRNFGLQLGENEVVTKGLLLDCTKLYNEEMEKHIQNNLFTLPQVIRECHEKAKDLIVGKLKETRPLTQNQEIDVSTTMDQLFTKYNLINNMKLNINKSGVPPAIGVDLGTTYSCVGVYVQDQVVIIPFENGDLTMPSYVSYDKNGSVIHVGEGAKANSYANPDDTIFFSKRIIGRAWDDENIQKDRKLWPFNVVNDDGKPKIKLTNGTLLSPEQVSGELLIKCRKSAETFLMMEEGALKSAVVTVPAYFTDGQRQATRAAAQLAGLEVLDLLNEPTAAGIAYYQERLDTFARRVLIFDMGGGTHDVAVLDMEAGQIESLGSYGNTHLGGGDFDEKMMEYCCAEFKRVNGIDLMEGKDSEVKRERDEAKRNMSRIRLECEKKKKQLSEAIAVDVNVDSVMGKDLKVEVTRKKFEELNEAYLREGIDIVEKALQKTGVSKKSCDDVVLVGGSSRIPRVKELLTNYFEGQALNRTIPPDHAVAYGAAIKAAILNGEKIKERFGLDTLRIQDVIPFSLGIEVVTKELSVILKKNSKIPVKQTKEHFTVEDNQTLVKIIVYEGEDFKVAENNKWLGTFVLEGIPPAPKRSEPIDVTMEIDGMGILEVSAVVRSTNGRKKMVIKERRLGMSKVEVDNILSQARNAA